MSCFNLWASLWATVSRWLTQATSNLSRIGLRSWSLGALKTVSFCQKPQWILRFRHKTPNWCNSKTCFPVSPKLHRQDESLTLVCPLSAIVKAPPSGNRKCQVLFFYRDFIRATWSLVSVIFAKLLSLCERARSWQHANFRIFATRQDIVYLSCTLSSPEKSTCQY